MDANEEFNRLCAENKVFPPEYICRQLNNITRDPGSGVLRLQSDSQPLPVYHAISNLLAKHEAVSVLDLSDCCLTSDTINIMLQGLMRNTSVRVLNLSGNNMTGSCVTILGDLLRVNTTLTKLYLEWNCIGQCQESFSQLCSGLAANTGLETLDLRNNQLSGNNAVILCHALTVNTNIRELDLRWNAMGPSGGHKFSELLQTNSNIVKLELQGNHLGKEFLQSIECLLNRNIDSKHVACRRPKSRSALSTPEKKLHSLRNGNSLHTVHFVNGSCDNLNGNGVTKYFAGEQPQDRSLKFLEKHKLLLLDLTGKLDQTQQSLDEAQIRISELQNILRTKETQL